MHKKSESGFGAVEIVLIIVVVAAIIVGGIYIFNSNNKSNPSSTQSDSSSQQATTEPTSQESVSNNEYLVINEWDVRLKTGPLTKDAQYVLVDNKLWLTTPEYVAKTDGACSANDGTGQLVRGAAGYDYNGFGSKIEENSTAVKVGDYYYLWMSPQAPCAEPTQENVAIMNEYGPAIAELAQSVEAVPAQ